jgi:hypothetical protein
LVLIAFLIGICYACSISFYKLQDSLVVLGIITLICFYVQIIRKDRTFAFTHLHHASLLFFIEYVVFSFLFTGYILFTSHWYLYFPFIALLFSISFVKININKKQNSSSSLISKIIPSSFFEWISGLRQSKFFPIAIYVLAIICCWFKILPLLLLWFINITIASYYTENETLHILRVNQLNAKSFLHKKLIAHGKQLLFINIPIVFIHTICNPSLWYVGIIFIPVQLSLICFAINFKYANYEPNEQNKASSFIVSLITISTLLPFLMPIPFIMAFRYYKKAINNLKTYLHD